MDKSQIQSAVLHYFSEQIPFNKVLGLQVEKVEPSSASISFDMRPELIGNSYHQILHGGVTAAVLDTVGGLSTLIRIIEGSGELDQEGLRQKLERIGTIDMRVDFIKPGRGARFMATSQIIRQGKKVTVCRMELKNERDEIIALGTATYMTG